MNNQLSEEQVEALAEMGDDVESVVSEAVADAGANDIFIRELTASLTFFGKTLRVWEDQMMVYIPEEGLDADKIRSLFIELANKIQIASHYWSESSAGAVVSASGITTKKAELITSLISYYHANSIKLPPNTVLDRMAE